MEQQEKPVSPFSFVSLELYGKERPNERDWREDSACLSDFKARFRESLVSDLPTNSRHI